MKKTIISALAAGVILLVFSILGLYITVWFFPGIAVQYFDPAFDVQPGRFMLYCLHPFIISLALSFFWVRVRKILTGSFIPRGIEFGIMYAVIAVFPIMWMIYSAMNVSLALVTTWFVLAVVQGIIAGLVFEKVNP
jgi:hypothetical protein